MQSYRLNADRRCDAHVRMDHGLSPNMIRRLVRWIGNHIMIAVVSVCLLEGCVGEHSAPAQQPTRSVSMKRTFGSEAGFAGFQTACVNCHGNPNVPDAPNTSVLREMSPEAVYDALASGSMSAIGKQIPDEMKRLIAEAATGRLLGTARNGEADQMPNRCPSNPRLDDPGAGPAWNGWGVDVANTRFQSGNSAGLTAAEVPRL